MPITTFVPGDVARSAEVNENFAYILSMLGQLSTPGRVKTTTEFLLGSRQNVLFTGTHDTGSADASGTIREYFQLGYNVDYNLVSGSWRAQRFISNNGASALRLGDGEVSFLATNETTESLTSALQTVFRIKEQDSDAYIYVPRRISFVHNNATPDSVGDYRLTYIPIDNPVAIYGGGGFNKAKVVKKASDFAVPSTAKMIAITCKAVASNSTDRAQIYFFRNQANPSMQHGFVVSMGQDRGGSGFGFVPLGTGAYEGEFYIERTHNFASITAYVSGYFL